jgi:hypothetical protein
MKQLARGALLAMLFTAILAGCNDDGGGETDGDSTDSANLSEFCGQLVSASDPFAAGAAEIERVSEDLRNLLFVAPTEIQPSLQTLLQAFDAVAAEADPDEAMDLLTEQQAELLAASDELAAYALANCGIDLNR